MNKLISEIAKVDIPLRNYTLVAATAVTSRAFSLANTGKAAFFARFTNIASTDNNITVSVLEATDAAATTAANIGGAVATPFVTVAPHTRANVMQLTANTPAVGNVVTVNGVEFTAAAAANIANRIYDQSGIAAAQAASLVLAINAHCPELIATANVAAITIQAREPGGATVTVEGITNEALLIPVTLETAAYIEVDGSTLSGGVDRVCVRVTPGAVAAAVTGDARLVRANARYGPVAQQAAASAFLPNLGL